MGRSKGVLLLGAWLVLNNVIPLMGVRIPSSSVLLTLLAVVAGVLLLVDR